MHRNAVIFGLLAVSIGVGSVVAIVRAQDQIAPPAASTANPARGGRTPLPAGLPTRLAQYDSSGQSVLRDRIPDDPSAPPRPLGNVPSRPVLGAPVGVDPARVAQSTVDDPTEPFAAENGPAANLRFDSDSPAASPIGTSGDQLSLSTQAPQVRVETTGPRSIAVGKESTYTVTMINDGQDSASDIFAQILLPASVEVVRTAATVGDVTAQPAGPQHRLKWDVPQMTAHSQERLEITVRPRTNAAFELAVDWAFQPLRSTASVEVQQPELKVTMAGATEMRYGEQTLYVITVSNPGTGAADNVTIDLGLGERIETMELGSLAAGEKKELEFPLVAAAAGVIRIAAVARADAGLRSEAASQITIRRAMLQLEVSAPKLKYAGAQASFQIAIRNTGDAPAENLAATIKLPAQAEYLSGLPGATAERGQLDWNVGTLSPGTQRVFNILCTLNQPGQNRLEAAVTDTTGLTANHVAVTEVQALADLKLVVNDPKGPIPVGEPVVYEVEVINRGSKAAQTIKVLGQFSAGIDPVHIEGAEGEISNDGQVLFDSITQLEAGQSIKLLITAKASADGNHRFRAQVTCSNPETNLVAEDTTRFVGEATVRAVGNSARLAPSAEPTPAPRQFEVRR